jgi:hypothetical protein
MERHFMTNRNYLRIAKAASDTGVSTSTLAKMPLDGVAPPSSKAERRIDICDIKEVGKWLAEATPRSANMSGVCA